MIKSTFLQTFIGDNRNPNSLANHYRRNRARILQKFMERVGHPLSILDVGGTENFWINSGLLPLPNTTITLLNLGTEQITQPGFKTVVGSGCDLSRWGDKEFDLVLSNSVLEHVGSAGNQLLMAREVQRVGRHYFIQTPARYFPFEPHFQFPFFWHLPEPLREALVCSVPLGWYPKQTSRVLAHEFLRNFLLLTEDQFKALFPTAKIVPERCLGMTKSYIAME